jgi:hypothetical protein
MITDNQALAGCTLSESETVLRCQEDRCRGPLGGKSRIIIAARASSAEKAGELSRTEEIGAGDPGTQNAPLDVPATQSQITIRRHSWSKKC